mgnify:CR=1 FL=1
MSFSIVSLRIASFVALVGCSVPQDAYTASKGAVLSLTRSLAVQFGPKGIRSNAICPGPVETAPTADPFALNEEERAALREAARRGLPLRLVHAGEGMPKDSETVSLPELKVPQSRARTILDGAVDQVRAQCPSVRLTAELIGRLPVPALVAEAESAELLVLGSQGFGGLGGLLAGSVATAVVTRVRTPVVLVREGFAAVDEHVPNGDGQASVGNPYRPVAVALDLAHDCDSLLDFAFEAARNRAAPLHAVYAWRLPHTRTGTDEGDMPARSDAEWALDSMLDPWRDKYPDVTVHAEAEHTRPVPPEPLLISFRNGSDSPQKLTLLS